MNKPIFGFKAFNKGLIDNYGNKYEVLKHYHFSGDVKFQKGGFHFCENIEDVLRYYTSFEKDIEICFVKGYGIISSFEDDYYGYYNMYASSDFKILKVLTKEEILDIILNTNEKRICRFISLYKLTEEEIDIILNKYNTEKIKKYILYYQKNDKKAFERKRK